MKELGYYLDINSDGIEEDTMNNLEEDGPRPMRNLRPAEKQPTSAEKFQADHDAEYEARGNSSQDKVGQVQGHNRACPRMYDELEKKRSLSNPNAFPSADETAAQSNQRQNSFTSSKQMAEARKEHICCNCLLRMKSNRQTAGNKRRLYSSKNTKRAIFKPQRRRYNLARNKNYCRNRYCTSCQSKIQERFEDVEMANNDYKKFFTICPSSESINSNSDHKQSRVIKKQNSNTSQNTLTHTCPIS